MTRLTEDDLGRAMPLVRPRDDGATTETGVNTGGTTVDIAAATRVVSFTCEGGKGRYRFGGAALTGGQANHSILDGERMTWSCDEEDIKMALKADSSDVTFEITEA